MVAASGVVLTCTTCPHVLLQRNHLILYQLFLGHNFELGLFWGNQMVTYDGKIIGT